MAEVSRVVLITGCSSGIGRATAGRLAGAGWPVYATARRPESIADLAERGCRTLALDVTDEESMRAAIAAVEEAEGAVGVLVNNAGYSQSGALEALSMERLRAQFETNVFGLVRMCQLALAWDAPPGLGADRERELDGRPADLSRRRRLPRHQARGRGALGRPALRGAGVRGRRGGDRARIDQDPFRRDRRGLDRRPRSSRATIPTPRSTPRWERPPQASTRGRWRDLAVARRRWPGQSNGRSRPGAPRPATG